MLKLGCHVGMSGKEMMLGSVKDAVAFGANTFMVEEKMVASICTE